MPPDLKRRLFLYRDSNQQYSHEPHVRGFVIEELCEMPSNWRSEESLEDYFKRHDILGIQGIDTRALTKHLRTRGAMKAILTTEEISDEEVKAAVIAAAIQWCRS